jgi:hypothetical protein
MLSLLAAARGWLSAEHVSTTAFKGQHALRRRRAGRL